MMQNKKQEWRRAEPHDSATLFQVGDCKIGMYQTIGGPDGRYAYQEDALISFAIPEFKNTANKITAMKNTFEALQDTWGQERMVGSTVCGTIAWQEANEIKTCNPLLGDGMQVLVILNSKGELKSAYLLNSYLQNPTHPEEQKRLSKSGMVRRGRLAGMLAVSGSIGDKDFEAAGLTHVPNITFENYPFEQGDKVFVVVTTDGLIEAGYNEKRLGQFISTHWSKSLEIMAKLLAQEAIKNSTDNISIGIFQVSNTPTAVFAFDGHGGPKVANNLATHFFDALREHIS